MPWLRLQGLESPLSSLLFCRAGVPHRLSGFQGRGGERYRLPWLHAAPSHVSEGLSERDGEQLGSDGLGSARGLAGLAPPVFHAGSVGPQGGLGSQAPRRGSAGQKLLGVDLKYHGNMGEEGWGCRFFLISKLFFFLYHTF